MNFYYFFLNLVSYYQKLSLIRKLGSLQQKKTIPIIIGDTKLPKKIPNLNQILFKGLKIVEFAKPKIKKIVAVTIAQILILPSFSNGYNDIIKKNEKKTIPKLLLEDIFI